MESERSYHYQDAVSSLDKVVGGQWTLLQENETPIIDREAAMAMEAHGVITGRQTHGVEADVDMRGEASGSSI
jgi:hypothetical protein